MPDTTGDMAAYGTFDIGVKKGKKKSNRFNQKSKKIKFLIFS